MSLTPAPGGSPGYRWPGDGVTSSQVFWLALVTRLTTAMALMPTLTASRAGRDAWLALLLSLPVALALAWVTSYVPAAMPRAALAEQMQKPLGKWVGGGVVIVFVWSYLHRTALVVRDYGEVVVSAVLPRTPLGVMVVIVGVVVAVMAAQETPVMARAVSILGPLVVVAVLTMAFLLAPQVELARLQPVLHGGWSGLFSGFLAASGWHTQVFFYPPLAPWVLDHPRSRRALLAGTAAATLLGAVLVTVVVTVMSAEVAVASQFPLYAAIRLVMIGDFVQRLDVLAAGSWGLSLLAGAGLFLHAAALSLTSLVGLSDHRQLVRPLALLVIVGTLAVGADTGELKQFSDVRVLAPYVIGHLWLPTAAWVTATARWRRRAAPGVGGQ